MLQWSDCKEITSDEAASMTARLCGVVKMLLKVTNTFAL
jgi:hypothetical protein